MALLFFLLKQNGSGYIELLFPSTKFFCAFIGKAHYRNDLWKTQFLIPVVFFLHGRRVMVYAFQLQCIGIKFSFFNHFIWCLSSFINLKNLKYMRGLKFAYFLVREHDSTGVLGPVVASLPSKSAAFNNGVVEIFFMGSKLPFLHFL